jgi:hypothetical protein
MQADTQMKAMINVGNRCSKGKGMVRITYIK